MDEDELKAKTRESYELLLDRYEPKAKAIAVEARLKLHGSHVEKQHLGRDVEIGRTICCKIASSFQSLRRENRRRHTH